MRTNEFEKAIEALNCEILRIQYHAGSGNQVKAAYGQVTGTTTYIMWDETGRAFVFCQKEDEEDCVSEFNLGSLPYDRDPKFDLKFE